MFLVHYLPQGEHAVRENHINKQTKKQPLLIVLSFSNTHVSTNIITTLSFSVNAQNMAVAGASINLDSIYFLSTIPTRFDTEHKAFSPM